MSRREDGAAAIELALGVGVLLFPVAILVLVLPTWVERQSMARVAAQEAARAVVLADSWEAGTAAGSALVRQVAANHGVGGAELGTVTYAGSLQRGGTVTASVTVHVPLTAVPGIGPAGGFTWTVTHGEQVDAYRSFP